ncbi:MAG: hypothetical protein GC155_05460 [Alphaproteobacteria bacterium]|nr:hypothetical protein [Alphaproteobacteria bacterium]
MWRVVCASALALGLAACGPPVKSIAAVPADAPASADTLAGPQAQAATPPLAAAAAAAPELAPYPDPDETAACQAGLKAHGLTPNEMWVMMHPPEGICPNAGVREARIREIAGFWEAAGCHKHSAAEILHALDSGACGGNAD